MKFILLSPLWIWKYWSACPSCHMNVPYSKLMRRTCSREQRIRNTVLCSRTSKLINLKVATTPWSPCSSGGVPLCWPRHTLWWLCGCWRWPWCRPGQWRRRPRRLGCPNSFVKRVSAGGAFLCSLPHWCSEPNWDYWVINQMHQGRMSVKSDMKEKKKKQIYFVFMKNPVGPVVCLAFHLWDWHYWFQVFLTVGGKTI